MAYTTISELPELLDINGDEYLLVTHNDESKKLKTSTIIDKISAEVTPDNPVSTNITIFNDGVEIGVVNKINFIGNMVSAFVNNDIIDVYIPNVVLDSIFNTNITTDARVIENIFENRFISNSNRYIGDWLPGSIQKVTNNTFLEYRTYEKFRLESNSKFVITLDYFDTSLKQEMLSINIDELNIGVTNLQQTNFYIDFNKEKENSFYKGQFVLRLDLLNLKGRVKISINYIGSETTEFIEEFFVDNSTAIEDLASLTINTTINDEEYKFLSGIKFIKSANIVNDITLKNSKNLTYPDAILDIDNTGAGGNTKTILAQSFISDYEYNTDVNYIDSFNLLNNKFYYNITTKARVNDWINGEFVNSTLSALIDTYTNSSTRIYESFVSETNRLNNYFNYFNSSDILGPTDLQVFNSRLIYPQNDYTEYDNPDYSSYSGNRNYIRKFWHNNMSHSNGIFQIVSNITETDLTNGDVSIEISLDSVNWYDCAKEYEGGELINGSGCRINSDINNLTVNKIEFTLGLDKYTDENCDWGIYFKIMINESAKNKFVDSLQILNWN